MLGPTTVPLFAGFFHENFIIKEHTVERKKDEILRDEFKPHLRDCLFLHVISRILGINKNLCIPIVSAGEKNGSDKRQ